MRRADRLRAQIEDDTETSLVDFDFAQAEARIYAYAQRADAPAELRDWFWGAVRRGCTDPDAQP